MRRAIGAADRGLRFFAAALVVALLAAVTAGVVSRAVGHPLSGTDEASGYLMVWLSCVGWMLATRHRSHIRIRFFQDRLRAGARRATEAAIQAAMAVLGGVVAVYAMQLVRTNADIEAMALPISAAWLYVPLLPAGLMTLAQALVDLWRTATHRAPAAEGGAA